MKYQFLIIASFCCTVAFGQTPEIKTTKTTTVTMSAAEFNKMMADVKVTDKNYYDFNGNVMDAADAKAKLRSFDYRLSVRKLSESSDFKNVLIKVNRKLQEETDSVYISKLQPPSEKLKTGIVLDTKPLNKYVEKNRLDGKIIALIFWSDAYYGEKTTDLNEKLNAVLTDYKIPGKIEILSITHHPAGRAAKALIKNPIVNTQHILDAQDITRDYNTGNDFVVVLTDSNHKILYSAKGSAAMTPRQFHKHLKALLK